MKKNTKYILFIGLLIFVTIFIMNYKTYLYNYNELNEKNIEKILSNEFKKDYSIKKVVLLDNINSDFLVQYLLKIQGNNNTSFNVVLMFLKHPIVNKYKITKIIGEDINNNLNYVAEDYFYYYGIVTENNKIIITDKRFKYKGYLFYFLLALIVIEFTHYTFKKGEI